MSTRPGPPAELRGLPTKKSARRVVAVAVTYHPDMAVFLLALQAGREQVDRLIVIDNGSAAALQSELATLCAGHSCDFIPLPSNVGIAAAQNQGIARALDDNASHVLLLDQDSIAAPDMVARLHAALEGADGTGRRIAAVGPRLVDRRSGVSTPFVRIGVFGVWRLRCTPADSAVFQTDFLVASGSLIPAAVLRQIGLMEEGLFIDNVDLEWCFRARQQGWILLGACDAVLAHSVGDQVVRIAGRALYRHGPLRQYYIMRNRILLYRRPYSPRGWVIQDFLRMLLKVVLFGVIFPPRIRNLRMMAYGVRDGLQGRSGPFPG